MTTSTAQSAAAVAETIDHEFKSDPSEFWPAARGTKTFEFRKDDRGGYHVGQTVRLRCYEDDAYTSDAPIDRRITNVLYPGQFGLQEGYCILSLAPLTTPPTAPALPDEVRARVEGAIRRSFDRASEKDGRLLDAQDGVADLLDTVLDAVDCVIVRSLAAPASSPPPVEGGERDDVLDALAPILPMAKGYAAAHPVGANQRKCDRAESILSAQPRPEAAADRLRTEIERALDRVKYVPGDYQVVPTKHDQFVKDVQAALARAQTQAAAVPAGGGRELIAGIIHDFTHQEQGLVDWRILDRRTVSAQRAYALADLILAATPPHQAAAPGEVRDREVNWPTVMRERAEWGRRTGYDTGGTTKLLREMADVLEAAILASRSSETVGAAVERVRHVKRGTEYEVLGEAEMQVAKGDYSVWPKGSDAMSEDAPHPARLVSDGVMLTFYRYPQTGKLWCRFTDEFRDGRFAPSPAPSTPAGEVK